MAVLADSAVALVDTWEGDGANSKRYAFREVILTLTGQGDATDTISAANLRLRKFRGATPLMKSDSSVAYLLAPSYDYSLALLFKTAADTPTTASGTYKCVVWGDS